MRSYRIEPAAGPLSGTLRAPGDKSIGHRAVLLAAIADGPVTVTGLGAGADNRATARAMRQMGVEFDRRGDELVVQGGGLHGLRAPAAAIDCGNSGTTMRLLCGLLSAQPFAATLTGDASLRRRPMARVVEPLRRMGADITGDTAPVRIRPAAGPLRGIDYALPVASAQVKSALLLAGLYADGATRIAEPGPSRDHTERMLRFLGAPVRAEPGRVTVLDPAGWDRRLAARSLAVPGDPSSAAFAIAAAVVAGGAPVRVRGVCLNPTRTGFIDALRAMGADVRVDGAGERGGETVGDVVVDGRAAGLRGIEVERDLLVRCVDEVPVLAAVAAVADGETWFRDAAELRVKESDRIATTAAMLRAFGVEVDERDDALGVRGRAGAPLAAADVDAAGDHRIAMAAVVAALAADGPCRVRDVANVATSYPEFADHMRALGVTLTEA